MQKANPFALASLSLLLLTSCGVAGSKMYDGHRVDVGIKKADIEKNRPNDIAYMLLVSSPSPATQYKEILLKVAARESGCTPIEETFVFRGAANVAAAVELDCG
jgi:hypothetical protein